MRTHRIAIVAVLLHAILLTSLPVVAQSQFYTVYVNGMKVSGYPLIKDGVAYLPANTLAQVLGVSVHWDSRLNIIKVNDKVVGARPHNDEGRLFLPVEAITHALGGTVEWDGRGKAIRISATGGSSAGAPPITVAANGPVPVTPPRTEPVRPPVIGVAPTVQVTPAPVYTPPPAYTPPVAYPTPTPQVMPPVRPPTPPPAPYTAQPGYTASSGVYVPKSAQNNVFAVTVTNIETVSTIKDFYHPRPGHRFIIVYLSQQNTSNEVQIYTGRFSLMDQNNRSHDYMEGLSNFWLVILRPYGINFGYLVFEMPNDAQPTRLALHALNQAPLTLNL